MAAPRHFLDLDRLDGAELRRILDLGRVYKQNGRSPERPLAGKTLAMIFEKPSTRTRISFEVAMKQLGGDCIMMSANDSQLSRGETVADTARVLSRYVDAIMIRTTQVSKLEELAQHGVAGRLGKGAGRGEDRRTTKHRAPARKVVGWHAWEYSTRYVEPLRLTNLPSGPGVY